MDSYTTEFSQTTNSKFCAKLHSENSNYFKNYQNLIDVLVANMKLRKLTISYVATQ